jgi:hypothetical protein
MIFAERKRMFRSYDEMRMDTMNDITETHHNSTEVYCDEGDVYIAYSTLCDENTIMSDKFVTVERFSTNNMNFVGDSSHKFRSYR